MDRGLDAEPLGGVEHSGSRWHADLPAVDGQGDHGRYLISHTPPAAVAQALVPAVSRLVSTQIAGVRLCRTKSVPMSGDAPGRSACATASTSTGSWADHLDGVVLARLAAHVAAGAETLVHLVLLIRTIRDRA